MTAKRIALAIDSLAGGGAEKVVLTLAQTLMTLGHQPHLLVMHNDCHYQVPPELQVHFCFDAEDRNIDSFWRLKGSVSRLQRWLIELEEKFGKFDLFLSNLDKTNLLMTRTGVSPLYCVVHNSIEEELKRQLKLGPFAYFDMLRAKKALNNQHLITVSKGIAAEIVQAKRLRPASMCTIYNPFELEQIEALSRHAVAEIPARDYLIHVGRFARQKRHDILFQALKLMQHKLPLVLLCNNRNKALRVAKKYGVEDRIIVPGFQANPFPWVKHARALVLSSDYEGLGNVLIESLVCGTPVVSTDCPHGPNEILTGHLAANLVPRRDPAALAAKLDAILSQTPKVENADILKQVDAVQVALDYLALVP